MNVWTSADYYAPVRMQPKLTVNIPGDIYEQEADRVAERVMRVPESTLPRACACSGACTRCMNEQDEHVQTKPLQANHSVEIPVPPVVHEVLRSSGQPLDPSAREFMERRFGHDFSRVRIHTDDQAATSARSVLAQAYTVGWDVVFGSGQFAPGTAAGRRLLAHELTHTLQQNGGLQMKGAPRLQRRQISEEEAAFSDDVFLAGDLEHQDEEVGQEEESLDECLSLLDQSEEEEELEEETENELGLAQDEYVLGNGGGPGASQSPRQRRRERRRQKRKLRRNRRKFEALRKVKCDFFSKESPAVPFSLKRTQKKKKKNTKGQTEKDKEEEEEKDKKEKKKQKEKDKKKKKKEEEEAKKEKKKEKKKKKKKKKERIKCCTEYDLSQIKGEELPAGRQDDVVNQETNRDLPAIPRGCTYTVRWDMFGIADRMIITDNTTRQIYWDSTLPDTGRCSITGPANVHIRVVPNPIQRPTQYNFNISKMCGRVKETKTCYLFGVIPISQKVRYIPYNPDDDYSKVCDDEDAE